MKNSLLILMYLGLVIALVKLGASHRTAAKFIVALPLIMSAGMAIMMLSAMVPMAIA